MSEPVTALVQKSWFERREFHLLDDKLRLFVKDSDGAVEQFISYENITDTTRRVTSQSGRLWMAAVSFSVFSLVGFVLNVAGLPYLMRWVPAWVIVAAILWGFHLAKRNDYLLVDLTDGKSLFFLTGKPSVAALEQFLTALQGTRKRYLRDRYFRIDPTSPPHVELSRFHWLLEHGIVTQQEFDEARARLDNLKSEAQATDGSEPGAGKSETRTLN